MGKPLVWFSVRRIDGGWRCIVWCDRRPLFTCYAGTRDECWQQAQAHLANVEAVTA